MIEAAAPNVRRTVAISRATVATPISASGSRIDAGLSPNSRTDSPMAMVASGGLSKVMKLAGSIEPKNHADQLCDAAHAAPE